MAQRQGRYTILLPSRPVVTGSAAVGTKKEGEGPLGAEFEKIYEDPRAGESSWEKAESTFHREAVTRALAAAGTSPSEVDMIFAGDLLNQCIGTTFGLRELDIPLAGLYGACSTMSLSLALAGIMTECGIVGTSVASTSSHFCSAEKQFRMPLEYGGQRPPTAQWTASAAGAAVIKSQGEGVHIDAAIIGRIQDLGIKDSNNMGAAMAPAAARTVIDFLRDTNSKPEDFDMILTGDLGVAGSQLLIELLQKDEDVDISSVHADCGLMLYDLEEQDVHAGASGCGCSGAVVCSYIMRRLKAGEINRVLFVGTGALMSPVSSLQGESIPSIAHGVLLTH
ncbi:MAG: stage V sporulation protein AD [Clostridiales bacterium]|jgi:stage V sporulation protein AD|nr:stage V sporulation protein AD [Clostridiales bacterium]